MLVLTQTGEEERAISHVYRGSRCS